MIRRLSQKEYDAFRLIRIEALRLHPESFGASEEEEVGDKQESTYRRWLDGCLYGSFDNDQLVGVAGFFVQSGIKHQHRGTMFSVYVKQAFRGQGRADKLVKAILAYAQNVVTQVHCCVVVGNDAALNTYTRNGFAIYGRDPGAIKIGDELLDELLLVKSFDYQS